MNQDDPHTAFEISLVNEQSRYAVNEDRLIAAARAVLADSCFTSGAVSLAIVDDETIHALNRQFLDHDFPTDVLSFALSDDGEHLEGEVIVSADTAGAAAEELGSDAGAEQLLYVIHGVLHLVGYGDKTDEQIAAMRAAEARYLRVFGFEPTHVMSTETNPR